MNRQGCLIDIWGKDVTDKLTALLKLFELRSKKLGSFPIAQKVLNSATSEEDRKNLLAILVSGVNWTSKRLSVWPSETDITRDETVVDMFSCFWDDVWREEARGHESG